MNRLIVSLILKINWSWNLRSFMFVFIWYYIFLIILSQFFLFSRMSCRFTQPGCIFSYFDYTRSSDHSDATPPIRPKETSARLSLCNHQFMWLVNLVCYICLLCLLNLIFCAFVKTSLLCLAWLCVIVCSVYDFSKRYTLSIVHAQKSQKAKVLKGYFTYCHCETKLVLHIDRAIFCSVWKICELCVSFNYEKRFFFIRNSVAMDAAILTRI